MAALAASVPVRGTARLGETETFYSANRWTLRPSQCDDRLCLTSEFNRAPAGPRMRNFHAEAQARLRPVEESRAAGGWNESPGYSLPPSNSVNLLSNLLPTIPPSDSSGCRIFLRIFSASSRISSISLLIRSASCSTNVLTRPISVLT